MEVVCYLNDFVIDEPEGLASLELSLIRDETYHGIGFEASTGTLQFRGSGREVLKTLKEGYGIEAEIILRVDLVCEGDVTPDTVYEGRMNMGTYREVCGLDCYVEVQTEEDSCMVKFKSRFDQQVDIDALKTFDKVTDVLSMPTMTTTLSLPGVKTDARVEGYIEDGGQTDIIEVIDDIDELPGFGMWFRPTYLNEVFNGINNGEFSGITFSLVEAGMFGTSPQLLLNERNECFSDEFEYEFRFKGSLSIPVNAEGFNLIAAVYKWNGVGDWQFDTIELDFTSITSLEDYTADTVIPFDVTFTGSTPLLEGESLYGVMQVSAANVDPGEPFDLTIDWDEETKVLITNTRDCPDTTTEAYLIHETLSRVVECVTDQCAVVKSEYYGREDSAPYSFFSDGCGSKRILTSGLKIRNAENPFFFASPKQLIEGLRSIDNIGFGLEDGDAIPGVKNIRIEPVQYFYQDIEIALFDHIPEGTIEVREDMFYSIVKIGYRKWEAQRFNGLNEFNSTRQYRTNFETINKTLEIESELVAASLAIESVREQNFATSGAADTTYDNDIFIICVTGSAGSYSVELEPYSSAINVFAPESMYNFRISPARNMLRWFVSIANAYANIFAATSVLYFSSGTGNVVMESQIVDDCTPEIVPIAENDDINWAMMFLEETPEFLWNNETFTFEYPLSLDKYNQIKASPYGYVSYQCGEGSIEQGWIKEIKYRPIEGMATFTLIKRYEAGAI